MTSSPPPLNPFTLGVHAPHLTSSLPLSLKILHVLVSVCPRWAVGLSVCNVHLASFTWIIEADGLAVASGSQATGRSGTVEEGRQDS